MSNRNSRFQYVPASGALPGVEFEHQTEAAINELSDTALQAKETAEQAASISNEALQTAANAIESANKAQSTADNALNKATDAATIADSALRNSEIAEDKAKTAFDKAANAQSGASKSNKNADEAKLMATEALTNAHEAKTESDTTKNIANVAIESVQNSLYYVDAVSTPEKTFSLDEQISSRKYFIDTVCDGIPGKGAESGFLTIRSEKTDINTISYYVYQDYHTLSDKKYSRAGVVTIEGKIQNVAWNEWTLFALDAHNTDATAHTNGISGNAATATRLKPTLTGARNQCWLLCKLPKAATALVHYKILGAQYYDQYSTLEVVIKNGFGWCKYVGSSTNYQVYVRAYDTGSSIDVYLFAPGYCDYWEVFLQKNGAVSEFNYKKMGDATYVPTGTLVCDTSTGLGMSGVELFNAKSSTGESVGHIGFTISNIPEGCLTLDTGALVSRTTYPELWAFVQSSKNLLPTVTDAQWQTMASNQTSVAAFSTGDGSTTFRLPKLLGWAKGGVRADAGDTHEAGLPNITGSYGYIQMNTTETRSGCINVIGSGNMSPLTLGSGCASRILGIDASKSNAIYGASMEVQPAGFVAVYYIRAFHGSVNQGNVDITALANEKANTNLSNINEAGKQTILDNVISSGAGYIKFSNGTLIQYGIIPAVVAGGYAVVTYPISFLSNTQLAVTIGTAGTAPYPTGYSWGLNCMAANNMPFSDKFLAYPLGGVGIGGSSYIAIGRWK